MKYSVIAAFAFATFAAAQVDNLPVCAQSCITAAITKTAICDINDRACQCVPANKITIQTEATTCVLAACGDKAVDVLTAAEAACAALSASSSAAPATTTTAAATTSAAAATTTAAATTSAAAATTSAAAGSSSAAASSSAASSASKTTSLATVPTGAASKNMVSVGGAMALGLAVFAGL